MQVFPSKIDTWLLIVLLVTVFVSVGAALLSINKGTIFGYISALFVLSIGAILPAWLLLSTKYIVTGEQLVIRSGPFSWQIRIASISSVGETRDSRSSPALSLERLKISYANGRSIMVSPRNREGFKAAIGHQ